jgi:HAE1 family hydrophobic/amphiphilic exporter-1
VPLWFASGSGAAARQILGTVVIAGMLADTLIAGFLIPVSFYVVERFSGAEKKRAPAAAPQRTAPATGD